MTAGSELTFDYQFQRYGKEAQKCFCGAPSCRGLIGGETRVSVRAAGGKKQRDRSRKKDTDSALTTLDEELEALQENGEGLYGEKAVISLCRLMVRVETMEQRLTCLKLIQNTQNSLCLKQFLDHHGLSLLWIFMVELSEAKSNSVNNIKLQLEIMKTLAVLPISTKNSKPIYYIDSLHIEWNISSLISWHFVDYGLQIMKTQNSVSQKIIILHKIIKKGYFKQKCQASEKYVNFYALNTWLGLLLPWITASMRRGMEAICLWHCSGVKEAQVALIAAFRSSALLGLVFLIFLLTIPIDSLWGSGQTSFLDNQAQ